MNLFAIDLGNKQVKMKSEHTLKVFPSYMVPAEVYGDRDVLGFAKKQKTSSDFESKLDEGAVYVWGEDMKVDSPEYIVESIGFGLPRYQSNAFKLQAEFALAELAKDFEDAKTSLLEVTLVTGVPTEDYNNRQIVKAIEVAFKGDHNVTVDGEVLNIRVSKVLLLPQSLGTIIDQVMDETAKIAQEGLMSGHVGVVDIGGGTVLIDSIKQMNLSDEKQAQLDAGAFTLYKAIVKEMYKQGYKASEFEVARIIRDAKNEKYTFSPNGVMNVDITEIVMNERKAFTRKVSRFIAATYKDMSRMPSILITGGAANIIVFDQLKKDIVIAKLVENSEVANVNGFYKYGLSTKG